ncbi:1813_t:CDS:2 [Entrophospora sp. SA101]|nr:12155_t:CDS:2 [Entrophospora sp. SA101]CAJ0648131.1 16638_t:CDS:2 [Entrophospora sp. SA101]CAJ0758132.1 1813_t:CDS:2 [Entrophospora sp. SA101]CAJ0883076.1 1974_t:CDS:2 [Entrophospora sp. SA101]CAJ0926480.1 4818_t:CDS:2 [Entrophospora sp. SA101]
MILNLPVSEILDGNAKYKSLQDSELGPVSKVVSEIDDNESN